MTVVDRVRVEDVKTLSDNWYILKKTTFSFLRSNGTWQRQSRETYDRGNTSCQGPLLRSILVIAL